jgi:hypothetical protein
MLSTIAEIIRDLLAFGAVMFAMFIVPIVVVSKMPDDNPLKRILTALSQRVGVTLAAGVVAIPLEPIPGIDALYDLAVPIALLWYWYTFFRDNISFSREGGAVPQPNEPSQAQTVRLPRQRQSPPETEHR